MSNTQAQSQAVSMLQYILEHDGAESPMLANFKGVLGADYDAVLAEAQWGISVNKWVAEKGDEFKTEALPLLVAWEQANDAVAKAQTAAKVAREALDTVCKKHNANIVRTAGDGTLISPVRPGTQVAAPATTTTTTTTTKAKDYEYKEGVGFSKDGTVIGAGATFEDAIKNVKIWCLQSDKKFYATQWKRVAGLVA